MGKLFDTFLTLLAAIAGAVLVTLMLMTVVKVLLRVVFNHGVLGVDQVSGIMMVYMTFLGAAWVLRRDGHVTIDILLTALPPSARRTAGMLGSLVAAAACLILAWYSGHAVLTSIRRGVMVAAELEIPRAVNLAVIPLGSFLLGIEFLRRAGRFARGELSVGDVPRMEA